MPLLRFSALFIFALLLVFPATAVPVYYSSATDPAGDNAGLDDLVFSSARVAAGVLTLEVRFNPATFSPGHTSATFNLDFDQDPGTGFAGVDSVHNDSAIFGADAVVHFPSYINPFGRAFVWNGVAFVQVIPDFPFTTLVDGYSISLPFASLGPDDGIFNFKVVVQRALTDASATGISDYLTDLRSPPVTTALIPEPATLALFGLGLGGLSFFRRRRG